MSYIEEVAQGRWYQPELVKGYSEDEIKQIEALYGICIQGEFKQFMRCMGRSSGGLLAEDSIMLYNFQPTIHMILYKSYNDELLYSSGYDFSYKNSFFFACLSETHLYFLKTTSDNPDRVYHHVEGSEDIRDTGQNFTEFLKGVVINFGDDTPQDLQYRYTGELLPQSTHIGAEYVDDYLNKQQAYINELIKIHPNRHYDITQIKGFSLSEISAFEHVYRVYHYSEGSEDISDTGQNFTEFLKGVVLDFGYDTPQDLQYRYTGELLPQSTHIGAEYVDDYLNKQQAYINELIKIHPNRHYDITQIKGYSLSEISAFEHVYEIQITGQLKDFMHYMGRSSGGLLSDDFIFYNKMSLIEKVYYIDSVLENKWRDPDNYSQDDRCFIFMTYKRDNHFFLVTNRKDADMVHHYNSYDQILAKTGKTFLEFIKEVIKYS
ncbi:SMI1/KNR4 family protein [Psychrobacter sp. I-STPA6b]|uniref:SMI1/KNR4 family protein n=1 Tax=Psychrobacter sp. I-STPA6b TaxID=2585718 RepID=UPI001D0CA915|nr:SMI1/KNR4 family protein [Psychrobacter sp. I-STPA6b]